MVGAGLGRRLRPHRTTQRYLNEAVTIANYVNGLWDTGTCGGGVWWNRERTYKNAVTNGLYMRLTASLHNRLVRRHGVAASGPPPPGTGS